MSKRRLASRPAAPIARARAGSAARATMAADNPSTVVVVSPVTPGSTVSLMPGDCTAAMGLPAAIASMMVSGWTSLVEAVTKASAVASQSPTSSKGTMPVK